MFLYFLIMISFVGKETQSISLSSNEHSVLFYESWHFNTVHFDDGVYFIIKGDRKINEGLTIYRWTKTGFEKLFITTPREGIFDARATVCSQDGSELYMSDYLAGIIFKYEPNGQFKRYAAKLHTETLFTYNDVVVRGNKFPLHNLETATGKLDILDKINRQLPDDASHSCEGKANFNEMVLLRHEDQLYLTYKLYDKVLEFDLKSGALKKTFSMKNLFRGYAAPVEDYFEGVDDPRKNRELVGNWLAGFHSLVKMAWRDGALYGFFRKGSDSQGVWVNLTSPSDFVWNNDEQETKLLSMGPKQVITGHKEEKEDGEITWFLYLNSSLPSL